MRVVPPPRPMPWTIRLLEVLDDGRARTLDELVRAAGPLVPPGRAARISASERARDRARRHTTHPAVHRERDSIDRGQRVIVIRSLHGMARSGRVVHVDGLWKLGDR